MTIDFVFKRLKIVVIKGISKRKGFLQTGSVWWVSEWLVNISKPHTDEGEFGNFDTHKNV